MEKSVEANNFLGKEKVGKLLKMFAIPCVLSLIIQALYNLVDQIFIGHSSLGAFGNAATGIVYPLTVVALAFGLWLGDGTAANLSLKQGRNDTKGSAKSVGTAISIGTIISLVLTVLMLIFKEPILYFLGGQADPTIQSYAVEYSIFISIGFFFFILACVLNPIVRADGSPKFAMLAMAIGAVTNIVLDPIFIFGLDMGMTGAALATFIGQFITFVLHIVYLFKAKTFQLTWKDLIPSGQDLKASFKYGISSFLTQISIVIISVVNNILLVSFSGIYTPAVTQGVITLAFKVFGIVVSIVVGIAAGGQPIIGYNYGAKQYDRVKETFKKIMTATIIVGIVSTLIFEICPQIFLYIFGDGGAGVNPELYRDFTCLTFRIYLGFILLTCVIKAASIFFQSIGKPVTASLISMFRELIFLIPATIILVNVGGIDAMLWSAGISDVLTFIFTVISLVLIFKKLPQTATNENSSNKTVIHKSKQGIIITISREHGSGGREIAKNLAKELGIPFYDKEISSLIAKETGLSNEFINNMEENPTLFNSLYLSKEVTTMSMSAQTKLLNKIAENGSCVILGRAADFILKDYDLCRVFVYAPMDYKIKRVMNSYGDNEEDAKNYTQKSDKKRASFYNDITGQTWGNKENYDICINGEIGTLNAVKIIKEIVK